MPKDLHADIQTALENAVQKLDMDGVLYRLGQIAVMKRNQAEEHKPVNKAEVGYWQSMIHILAKAEEAATDTQ